MARSNDDVARALGELATLTELDEGSPQAFRVRAYQNAEHAVQGLSTDVAELSEAELAAVKGIGKSIAARIREYVDTGTIGKLDELRAKHPASKLALLRVPGLGPRSVQLLQDALGVTDVDGLVEALHDGRVAGLKGMGRRTAENLEVAVTRLGLTSKDRRVTIATALPLAARIVEALRRIDGVQDAAYAGSVRRFREDIGDVDVLVATDDPDPVTAAFVGLGDVDRVLGSGGTRSSIVTRDGVQVDLRVVPPESFGAALLYFTGSKAHNIRLRQRALARGWTLNEYALADKEDGGVVAGHTEQDVYAALELPWITPERREDDGELEAAVEGRLEAPLLRRDLRGDLHDHTDRSGDGRDDLETLVAAAVDEGLEYLAITDHAEDLAINGVSREGMLEQRAQLRALEERRGDIRLLHGAELNIGVDGSLDYDEAFRAGFDWLVASVHSHFGRGVAEQTARVVAAIRDPSVTAIGHLTGRKLGRRPGVELDLEAVLDAAAQTGTAIEINASIDRLDASASVVREGLRRGVVFVVSSDAHAVRELQRLHDGAAQCRRAGATPDDVANTWPVDRFLDWVATIRS